MGVKAFDKGEGACYFEWNEASGRVILPVIMFQNFRSIFAVAKAVCCASFLGVIKAQPLRMVVVTGMVVGLVGCRQKPSEEVSKEDMLSTYKEKIPVGTSLKDARAIMEADGFVITEKVNARWRGKNGFTFLCCVRDDGMVIKRRWEIALMHNGQFVTGVDIRPGLVYP